MFLQLRNKTQSIGILLLPTISLQNDMRTTYAPFKCLQLSSAPLYLFFLRLISAQISQGGNVYSQHTFVSLLIEEFSEISASSIYFVSIFLSRWTGCPKSGQREQHFPLMLSPCWIISPQICTPCPSSALPLQLWTVRAALHGPTLRESTSPSTGRWVYTHTFFFEKYGLIEFFFFFFLLKRLNHFRHKNAFSLVSCGLFLLCNLSFFFLKFIYEDSMDLIAKLPCIAAKIYRNLYREGSSIGAIDSNLDWSHNFTNMLGYSDPQFTELMRLYLTIHRCNLRCLFT